MSSYRDHFQEKSFRKQIYFKISLKYVYNVVNTLYYDQIISYLIEK